MVLVKLKTKSSNVRRPYQGAIQIMSEAAPAPFNPLEEAERQAAEARQEIVNIGNQRLMDGWVKPFELNPADPEAENAPQFETRTDELLAKAQAHEDFAGYLKQRYPGTGNAD